MQGNLERSVAGVSKEMRKLMSDSNRLASEYNRLEANLRNNAGVINSSSSAYARLDSAYRTGLISQSAYAAGTQRLENNIRQATNNLQRYEAELNRVAIAQRQNQHNQAQLSFQEHAGRTVGSYQNMMGAVNTARQIASPLTDAITTAMNFEAAMSKVGAISIRAPKGTVEYEQQLKDLTDKARDLGATTQFSASQAAEAMSYLGMAGWDTNQIIGGMNGLLALAGASGTALGTVADIVSDDLTAFGLSADQAGHMADVFSYVVTRTNTDVTMLGETMKYAAPVARAFGASMEETAALAGLMANSGVKASQAGTSLRAGLLRLAGPPKKASKEMDELGISLDQACTEAQEAQQALAALGIETSNGANGQKKMGALLTELREKTAGLSREEKMATLGAIFGTNAVTGWLAVIDSSPELFDAMVNEMEKADGMAAELNEKMMNNAKGGFTQLKSALESIAISIGSVFLPALASGARDLAGLAGSFSKVAEEHPALIKAVTGVGAAVAGSAIGFFALSTAINAVGTCSDAIDTVRSRMLFLEAQITRTNLANTAFGTRLSAISTAFNGVSSSAGTFGSLLKAKIAAPFKALGNLGGKLAGNISGVFTAISGKLAPLGSMLTRVISPLGGMFTRLLAPLSGMLAGPLTTAFGGLITSIGGLGVALLPVAGIIAAVTAAGAILYSNWDTISQVAEIVYNKVTGYWDMAMQRLQPAFDSIGQSLERLGTTFSSFGGSSSVLEIAFNTIGAVISGVFMGAITVIEVFVTAFAGAFEIISTTINEIGVIIQALAEGDWSAAWNSMGNIVSTVVGGIISTVSKMVSAVTNGISSIMGLGGGSVGGGGAEIAANAQGGIYRKGAFLTTFAEEGPEAAIPLDGSKRAKDLWYTAGSMLGLVPDNQSSDKGNYWNILENLPVGSSTTNNTENNSVNQPINISIPVTVNGNADSNTVGAIQGNIENIVRKVLADISDRQRRVSLA